MEFSDTEVNIRDVLVLQIVGEIDLSSSARLRRRLQSLLERNHQVVVDLTEVSFIDSAGLRVLDEVHTSARQNNVSLSIVCPPGRTLRLFEITGLDDHFSIHPSLEVAVGSSTADS